MVGVATGLAEAGYIPFVYSIATFASMRAYEFIRNGPVLHQLPVRIVGVGGGLDYGHNGMTHFALEDVAMMRVQPALPWSRRPIPTGAHGAAASRICPGRCTCGSGRTRPWCPGLDGRFALGRPSWSGPGDDVALVALGPMAAPAIEAAERLGRRGIRRDGRRGVEPEPVAGRRSGRAARRGAAGPRRRGALRERRPRLAGRRRSSPSTVSAAVSCGPACGRCPRASPAARAYMFERFGLSGRAPGRRRDAGASCRVASATASSAVDGWSAGSSAGQLLRRDPRRRHASR